MKDNTVEHADTGILVENNGTVVTGNNVEGCASSGVYVFSTANRILVDRNVLELNSGCGLFFGSSGNAYRDNMLRGNTGGAVCGNANTDAGGNII